MRYLPVGLFLVLWAGARVSGQTMPSPAEQMLNDMLHPAGSGSASSPTTRPQPPEVMEPAGYVPAASSGGLLREGSDIIARRGHLKKVPDSPYSQFLFDRSAGSALAPMLVLPNLQLMSMEDASAATRENLHFTVSGLVTEYRGKNFILLEPGPDALSRQSPSPVPEYQPAARGPVSADQMLKEMLSADKPPAPAQSNANSTANDSTSGSGALAPNAPVVTVLPEQAQIFDRVCRLGPCSDGLQQQLTFDADGSTLRDPPLIVLPNLKLADLEKAAGDQHNTRIRATGMVTEYRGRNYILLQKIVVMADSDRQF
jgi:hypothetical protein